MAGAHKVMLLGDIGVGKSSLARRLAFDRFDTVYKPTIGVEVYRHQLADVDGSPATLILWDTDGNFGDAVLRHVYVKQASAALIIGDRTRPETLAAMVRLADGFGDLMPGRAVHFVVNKCDLPAAHGVAAVVDRLRSTMPLAETSALDGTNVAEAFHDIARSIRRRGL
jgi:small GTP-binding protein